MAIINILTPVRSFVTSKFLQVEIWEKETKRTNEAPPVGGSKWFAHLPIRGWGGVGGGVTKFDAKFKFAKIQNSHL